MPGPPRLTIGQLMFAIAVLAVMLGVARYNLLIGFMLYLEIMYLTILAWFAPQKSDKKEDD